MIKSETESEVKITTKVDIWFVSNYLYKLIF